MLSKLAFKARRALGLDGRSQVRRSFTHLSGPKRFALGEDDVGVVIVGRNASFFLEEVVEHHRRLGATHFVYVDNGSQDHSADIMAQQPNTIVARCTADFRSNQAYIRYFATTLYLTGGWRLVVDADELFDYPGSGRLPLPELVKSLRARGFDAVVAQMLEMVPPGSLTSGSHPSFSAAIGAFDSYSLENITAFSYHDNSVPWRFYSRKNRISNPDTQILFGGLRRSLFGENCCLTKHPLFRMHRGVSPLPHPHVSTGLCCADFTALIRHYKFADDFFTRERRLLQENRIAHGETALRVAQLERDDVIRLDLPGMEQNPTFDRLLAAGFLVASDEARKVLGIM